jgi:formylglycine-generating enzyme required for sulfatase activity
MHKNLFILLFFIGITLICSCGSDSGDSANSYTIGFYDNGIELTDLNLTTEKGNIINLPVLDERGSLIFGGWLQENTDIVLTGEYTVSGKTSFHAKWYEKFWTSSIGTEFRLIPAGSFIMGSSENEPGRWRGETAHKVTITKPFYMGRSEVTQKEWRQIMGTTPSYTVGENNPVDSVSWEDVQEFISRLNNLEGSNIYRLPTEAEWEYAARAGTTTAFSFGDDASKLALYAWYYTNSGLQTHPVMQLSSNDWDLFDMHGNVYEWVEDWYSGNYYSNSPEMNPSGPETGSWRVIRGGSWSNDTNYCRSAFRLNGAPDVRYRLHGFRLVALSE